MERIKVCLVEDDKYIRGQMADYIRSRESLELMGTAEDGLTGAELLRRVDFDAAIISAILPYKDGLTVMKEYLEESPERNVVFAVRIAFSQEPLIASVINSGADCFFLKPEDHADADVLFGRIAELYNAKAFTDKMPLGDFVDELLRKLGISGNLKGHKYLKSAIIKTVDSRSVTDGITKILYPNIARENSTTSSRVERDIRHAISESWKNGSSRFADHLKHEHFRDIRPTNRSFILAAADAFESL